MVLLIVNTGEFSSFGNDGGLTDTPKVSTVYVDSCDASSELIWNSAMIWENRGVIPAA